jgi:exopolyphosphatase/guanosine-5'-triphosphate,3'-diphosphate pyrophosphatase
MVVTLGATGTNLVSIREGWTQWQPDRVHGQVLLYEEISKAAGWMLPMLDLERARIPGIEAGRERTLAAGALILERFLFGLRAESCVVSIRGWRYAMLERTSATNFRK